MKIPCYDTPKKETNKHRLNGIFPEDYRCLITGQSNCGKTNLLMHILRHPLVYYDKIIMYTNNGHQDKLKDLESLMNDISKKIGYNVLEIKNSDEIMDTSA